MSGFFNGDDTVASVVKDFTRAVDRLARIREATQNDIADLQSKLDAARTENDKATNIHTNFQKLLAEAEG